jgi:ADP-heptose:LPS heptosyltransferase
MVGSGLVYLTTDILGRLQERPILPFAKSQEKWNMDVSVAPNPTILITRLSHIGDCILTLPMLSRIKQTLPHSRIVWAVESPTDQLLELIPEVDQIFKVPKGWLSKPGLWRGVRSQLRSSNIDIAIDPQGITKSAALGWISGAKRRIGIRGRWGRELSTRMNNELVSTCSPHIVDRSLELVSSLCQKSPMVDKAVLFDLPVCKFAQADVDLWLERSSQSLDLDPDNFVLINPGGSWASKRWEMDRLGQVADKIKNEFGMTSVVVWAGEDERAMAEGVAENSNGSAVVARPTSLRELAGLAKRSKFFIGGDTGPMHIAAAVGTPCVGLYGTTRPEESGAYGPQHVAVQKWYQSGSCRERRQANNDAMRDISVADVFLACRQMVSQLSGDPLRRVA